MVITTPQKTGDAIDRVINKLNGPPWKLELSRIRGPPANKTREQSLSEKCFNQIRFLCWRTNNIDAVIAEFTTKAAYIRSQRIFKPSQEQGTLPVLPVQKSFIRRDDESKGKDDLRPLSPDQRAALLRCLYETLQDPVQLAKLSESFSTERASTSAPSFTTAPTTPTKRTLSRNQEQYSTSSRKVLKVSESVKIESSQPPPKNSTEKSSKRTRGSPNMRNKRHQTTMSQFLIPRPTLPAAPPQTSFETAPSAEVSAIFSDEDDEDGGNISDATSILSTQENTQDMLPTQEVNLLFEDEAFRKSFNESCPPPVQFDATDLLLNTPFKRQAMLPTPHLPFWYCWEIHRVSSELNLLPIDLNKRVANTYKKHELSYEEFWTEVEQICSQKSCQIPQKSGIPKWVIANNRYEDEQHRMVVHLTATLDWEDDLSRGLFKLRLNTTQLEKSCRFHRKFGSDRFLLVSIPLPSDANSLPKLKRLNKGSSIPLSEKITTFLASSTHFVAGRYWRVCNVEEEKTMSRSKKDEPKRVKITMFAQSGYGISGLPMRLTEIDMKFARQYPEIGITELIEWHMPIDANRKSTDLKLFSRMGLGFSKTIPTIELYQHEFLYRHDPPHGRIMDDGCAMMSFPLARAIWKAYGGEGEIPSVVQGRISGAKGLWLVDYEAKFTEVSERDYWIEVSDSQLKIKPHPRDRPTADSSQRTFEVLKYWADRREGHLNRQLVTILEDRGVPRSLIRRSLENDLTSFSDALSKAMENPVQLRLWMQENGVNSRSSSNRRLGTFPVSEKLQMKELLEAGFHPAECEKLWAIAADMLGTHMSKYLEKMKIRLADSTVVFCAPDPCGVLEEDEVFLSFSKPVIDPRTGLSESALDNIGILVARNPAYLANDMQLRRAVYKRELRHYKDVILFSTKGQYPTAHLLSGGDYDGDTVTCIWDPDFVNSFRNVPNPPTEYSERDCKLRKQSRLVSDIFKLGRPKEDAIQDFLRYCFAFNARLSLLGACSTEHERLVYNLSQRREAEKLSNKGAVKLAALAGYLVDSNKSGWDLSWQDWIALRREVSGNMKLVEPAYKSEEAPRATRNTHTNVLDFLKFEVATHLSDQTKETFSKRRSEVGTYDPELAKYWQDAESTMEQEDKMRKAQRNSHNLRHGHGRPPMLSELLKGEEGLQGRILQLKELWNSQATPNATSSSTGDRDNKEFECRVQTIYQVYKAIEPRDLEHPLRQRHEREMRQHHPFPYWSLLKASCLYHSVRGSKALPGWAWYIAGSELCKLKTLYHNGEVKVMTAQMHLLTKVDAKFTKGLLEASQNSDRLHDVDEDLFRVDAEEEDDEDDDDTVALD